MSLEVTNIRFNQLQVNTTVEPTNNEILTPKQQKELLLLKKMLKSYNKFWGIYHSEFNILNEFKQDHSNNPRKIEGRLKQEIKRSEMLVNHFKKNPDAENAELYLLLWQEKEEILKTRLASLYQLPYDPETDRDSSPMTQIGDNNPDPLDFLDSDDEKGSINNNVN